MKFLFVNSALLLLFSCSQSKKSEENRDLLQKDSSAVIVDTLMKKDSIVLVEQEIKFDKIPASKNMRDRLNYFKEAYKVNYAEISPEELKVFVLDRFTSNKKYKLYLEKLMPVNYGEVENIFPIITIHAYEFVDSAQRANAVNNWFNCFGNDCNTIKLNEEVMIKSTPGFYIINPTSIICLDYLVEHAENNWTSVINHLKKLFATKGSTLILVKPHGKLSWQLL